MGPTHYITALTAFASFVATSPAHNYPKDSRLSFTPTDSALRLVKTSPTDPGSWVDDAGKDALIEKGIRFFDITDIKDGEVLSMLSTPDHDYGQYLDMLDLNTELTDWTEEELGDQSMVALDQPIPFNAARAMRHLKTMTEFWSRDHRAENGTKAADWILESIERIVALVNPRIESTAFTHNATKQPSIIAKLPGATSDIVVFGAHFDSTSKSPSGYAPGADDNASGTVVLLELLRTLAERTQQSDAEPQKLLHNTIEFHFYAAEEAGLLGSSEIFYDYKVKNKTVVAMLNHDMLGFSSTDKVSLGGDKIDPRLTHILRTIAKQRGIATLSFSCGYACSDHASAHNNKYPAAFITADRDPTGNDRIHTDKDVSSTDTSYGLSGSRLLILNADVGDD
ncbi:leucine aminopeptidase 2 [Colletotrichum salicis]|uniref:Peptide hydrolase n=1 Tax=Colletotrichum salicis TaxID=1209931 RepID=A0A135V116_9PEZI|nr:leucine aminopeptidase 2 [Colletotrichum salicis]